MKFFGHSLILSEIPPHSQNLHYYHLITMTPTTLRPRTRLACKYLTLSIRGSIIGRRRGGASYRESLEFKKTPISIIFNTI